MISRVGSITSLIFAAALAVGIYSINSSLNATHSAPIAVTKLSTKLGDWRGNEGKGLNIRALDTLQLDQYVRRAYRLSSSEVVQLYVGYWAQQSGDYQAAKHSPAVCLPANGWSVEDTQSSSWHSDPSRPYKELVASVRSQKQLFRYWFFSSGYNYAQEWKALVTIGIDGLVRGRTDGGIVEISTPIREDLHNKNAKVKASETLDAFMEQLLPELDRLRDLQS